MSVVEDTRKVLQDFLAPEMRATNARFYGVDKLTLRIDLAITKGKLAEYEAKTISKESQQ